MLGQFPFEPNVTCSTGAERQSEFNTEEGAGGARPYGKGAAAAQGPWL